MQKKGLKISRRKTKMEELELYGGHIKGGGGCVVEAFAATSYSNSIW
jgi:hypothetical protein